LLDLLGVLEKRPHHPGVCQHDVQAPNRFFRAHRDASDTGAADAAGRALAGSAGGPDSDSSFEYNTSAAPEPTSTMPSHNDQCGTVSPKCNGWPLAGCQTLLTSVLITGARPKINGAMYSL